MEIADKVRWFAIQTRTQHERIVASALADKGYEEFLPLFKQRRRHSGEIRELEDPLFPGYVFCRFDPQHRLPVLVTPGVRQVVGFGRVPAPVADHEIEALRTVQKAGLPTQRWPFLKIGNWVSIECGALEGLEGILIGLKQKHRLVVSVSLLQRSVAVEIDEAYVTPIPP